MTVVMELLRRALPPGGRDPLPPRRVAVGLARKLGFAGYMDLAEREGLTWASHFGYGAGTGAGYGAVAPALRKALPHPAASGAAYGLAVWVLSYFGWLPAVGITSPQFRHPLRRNATLVLSHLVWGVTTGLLTARMTRRPSRKPGRPPRRRNGAGAPHAPPPANAAGFPA
jgi:uncharacterized membrane protein YagU involved in acid resistance